jgi:hypothetical protein
VAQAWVEGDRVIVRINGQRGGPGPAERPVAQVSALSAARTSQVGYRSADAITLEFLDEQGRRIAGLTMARGVPGVYLSMNAHGAMAVPDARGVALGWGLEYAESPVTRMRPTLIDPLAPIVVTAVEDVRVLVPGESTRLSAAGESLHLRGSQRPTTTFVGLHPLQQRSAALAAGAYAVSLAMGVERFRVERADGGSSPAWAARAKLLFPYVLDNAQQSGVAELASLGVNYRAAALP